MHLVIDFAENATDEQALGVDEGFPVYGEVDNDLGWAREILFRDHDVLLLFNESVDGVEDPESEASEHYRFANLHPSRWFRSFAGRVGRRRAPCLRSHGSEDLEGAWARSAPTGANSNVKVSRTAPAKLRT